MREAGVVTRQIALGVCGAALICAAGFVAAQTARRVTPTDATTTTDSTAATDSTTLSSSKQPTGTQPRADPRIRLSAVDTSEAAFRKLDTDHDGRISALEANQNPRVAEAFPMADKDKDGYLSREEFEAISSLLPKPPDVDAQTPSGDHASDPSGDQRAASPPR